MVKQKRGYSRSQFYGLLAFAGLLEYPVIVLLVTNQLLVHPILMVGLHLVASVAIFFAPPKEGGWRSHHRHWGDSLAIWTFAIPAFGWLIGGLLFWMQKRNPNTVEYIWEQAPETDMDSNLSLEDGQNPDSNTRILNEADLVPAVDALLGSDPKLKRGAIQSLAKMRTPDSIDWILKARTNIDPDVRFFATSTLTSLKRDFEEGIKAAEAEVNTKPMNLSLQIQLYQWMFEYAISGLVEEIRQKDLLQSCREHLEKLASHDVDALELLFKTQKGIKPKDALSTLNRLIQKVPEKKKVWLKERIQIGFQLNEFKSITKDLSELEICLQSQKQGEPYEPLDTSWKAAISWWSNA